MPPPCDRRRSLARDRFRPVVPLENPVTLRAIEEDLPLANARPLAARGETRAVTLFHRQHGADERGRGDTFIPVRDQGTLLGTDGVELAAVVDALCQPLARDIDELVAVIGAAD
jgi:hypothetical protein